MATGAALTFQTNASALAMAHMIFGSGVAVNTASHSDPSASSAACPNGGGLAGAARSATTSGANNNQLNDVIGVWENGPHIPITFGKGVTSVTNSNGNPQQNLALKTANGADNTWVNGPTVSLTPTRPLNVDVVKSIRIGCADASPNICAIFPEPAAETGHVYSTVARLLATPDHAA